MNSIQKIKLTAILSLLFSLGVYAQESSISGTVTAENGTPLPAVSITVKGTTKGTSTNSSGQFSIMTAPAATLTFSAVGYNDREEAVAGRTLINITLTLATRELEQVVVVGYGTSRRREITGSVASVRGGELAKQPVLTASQAVQGKVAGVQVVTSGDPNSLPTIRVRGTGTMLGGANPLYVVDGVINEDIRNINTADIVSMDILKDASSTAIYGMRAANGVILITTKKGRAGRMIVNYDFSAGVKEATKLVNMAGPEQYANYVNEANIYYGSGDSLVTRAKLNAGGNTDWYDAILKRGFFQNHNISMSGGNDKILYFFSAGYLSDEGIVETNKFKRFTLRSNNEYRIASNLTFSTLLSYSRSNVRNVDLGVFDIAYRAAPYVQSKVDGKYGNTSLSNNVGNPLISLDKKDDGGTGDRLQGTAALEYKPVSWIALKTSFGVDKNDFDSRLYQYKFSNIGSDNIFIEAGGNQLNNRSSLKVSQSTGQRWVWDNTATVTKSFGLHNFRLLAGTTAEEIKSNELTGTIFDVSEDKNQWFLSTGAPNTATNTNTGSKYRRQSYLGRLNYNYNDRYFLTASVRSDATSRLPESNRRGTFPSVGVSWDVVKESFMSKQNIFRSLKLRASYGKVASDAIPDNIFTPVATSNLPYFFSNNQFYGVALAQLADQNLRWEVNKEYDLGLDFTILKGRLSGTFDYYSKKNTNALIPINIPAVLGDPDNQYITNAAVVTNKGIELSLDWNQNINRDWKYSINVNGARNTNNIESLNGGQALLDGNVNGQFTTKSDNGQQVGSFYLLEMTGIFQSEDEIAKSAQTDARPGDIKYLDYNNDGKITDDDRFYHGSYQPKYTYGVNATVSFRSFDLSVGGYGTAGGKIYNAKKATRPDFRDNVETAVANDRWTPNNHSNTVPRATLSSFRASTYFLEKADFFRINNLTIGYNLPQSVISRAKMQSLRVFASAQNLVTFTGYSGFTPEINKGSVTAAGIEATIYPTTRTFVLGLNVGF